MEMEITFPGGARVDAAFDGFVIQTDQPPSDGGEGSAPTPFSVFLASFGACAGIYVLSFCRHRGIPTENIRIRQRVEGDLEKQKVHTVTLDILLPPEFPAKYARAVARMAEMCAVKKHLDDPPTFKVESHIVAV
jgi:ribosomal protein S12 methylthiotransferase accessory factor